MQQQTWFRTLRRWRFPLSAILDAMLWYSAMFTAVFARLNFEAGRVNVSTLLQVATVATEKDGEIARLSAEAGKVAGLEVALAERDTQLGHREAELEGIRNELAARQARIGELESRVGDLENEVTAVRRRLDALKSQPVAGMPKGPMPRSAKAARKGQRPM